jgi:hypothetical protein
MAKSKAKKETIILEKNAFIVTILFVIAVTMLIAYAFLNFAGAR